MLVEVANFITVLCAEMLMQLCSSLVARSLAKGASVEGVEDAKTTSRQFEAQRAQEKAAKYANNFAPVSKHD